MQTLTDDMQQKHRKFKIKQTSYNNIHIGKLQKEKKKNISIYIQKKKRNNKKQQQEIV